MSKVYCLRYVQQFPVSPEQAWDFFSRSANLAVITPPDLGLIVTTAHDVEPMYAGQLIEYTVRPLAGITVYWMTEIRHVETGKYFVDEQRYGPYSFWHHQHHFRSIPGGTEMTDIVHYKIPFWFLGDIANRLFVAKRLQSIFSFRYKKAEELFGKMKE